MPNYKLTKKSVKNARISKHKKSKSLINKMKGGFQFLVSNDFILWSLNYRDVKLDKDTYDSFNEIYNDLIKFYYDNFDDKNIKSNLVYYHNHKSKIFTIMPTPVYANFIVMNNHTHTFFYIK